MKQWIAHKNQTGFALIKLAVVIAILGIVVAAVMAKFLSISLNPQVAATNGLAGALASAAAENYAIRKVSPSNGHAVVNCTDIGGILPGGLPAGYTITSAPIMAGTAATCGLTGPSDTTATFVATGVS